MYLKWNDPSGLISSVWLTIGIGVDPLPEGATDATAAAGGCCGFANAEDAQTATKTWKCIRY